MSDATLFGRAVIDRLTALEVSLFGGVANYSDITNFERAVLARIGALEVQKFGSVTVEPDITSFTRAVLDRLTALEGAGTLGILSLSATTFTRGTSASGTIIGATALSTITASGLPSGLTINGAARTWAWDGTGSGSSNSTLTLTETLVGYSNTPHDTVIGYTINAAPATINAPTYALHTASGVSPASWDVTGDSTFQPGMWVHQQFVPNNTGDFSGGGGAVVDYYTEVNGSDWEATSESIGGGTAVGIAGAAQTFAQPAGPYSTRCRFETLPGDPTNNVTSAWSNVVSDTVTSVTTVLDAGNHNSNTTIGTASYGANLRLTGIALNAPQSARTTTEIPVGGKAYSEHNVVALKAGSAVCVGATDGLFTWSTTNAPAFNGNGAGLAQNLAMYPGGTTGISGEAATDIVNMCIKRTSSTSVTVWVGRNGTWTGDPSAETGGKSFTSTDTHFYGYVSVDNDVDTIDSNFGQVAFTYTKPTGATVWP